MKKLPVVFALIILAFVINSCKKDFSIYAPGESITIVTGFLDPSQDTQFVKINKTWAGDGNNLDYALIRDSSEYKLDEFNSIVVQEIIGNEVVETFTLNEIERTDKDEDGIFFGPEYTAYYFIHPGEFDASATYKLIVDFKTRQDVSAETKVVVPSTGNVVKPDGNPMAFASLFGNNVNFNNYQSRWTSYENAGRYSASFKIYYKEKVWADMQHTQLISEEIKTINWKIGERSAEDISANNQYRLSVSSMLFYELLKDNMDVDPFKTRELGIFNEDNSDTEIIDFTLDIANEDYDTFIEINEPSTSIVQEKPSHTNVQNGIGIFASRLSIKIDGNPLSPGSYNVIPFVDGLANLNLCTTEFQTDITCD